MTKSEVQFDIQIWWRKLDITWKRIFKRILDINHNPDINEIHEILKIDSIDCSGSYIISLEPLQHFKNLRKLNCSNTSIISLDKISELVLIDELDISKTKVKSLKPISNFSKLWLLKCNNTPLENLQGIEGCISLEYLYCSATTIDDIEPIVNLPNLKTVDCNDTYLKNGDPLLHVVNFLFDGTPYFEKKYSPDEVDLNNRDELFEDAARIVVLNQTGSTASIQRKFSIGYNRAGRIMDQLEAAGIVGINAGSKAREVIIQDENALEVILKSIAGDEYRPSVYKEELVPDSNFIEKNTLSPQKEIVQINATNHGFLKITSIILIVAIIVFCYLIFNKI